MTSFRPFAARGPQHVQAYIDLLIEKHAALGERYVERMLGEAVLELDRLQSHQALQPEAAHQGGQGEDLDMCMACNGTGAQDGETCGHCGGHGFVVLDEVRA